MRIYYFGKLIKDTDDPGVEQSLNNMAEAPGAGSIDQAVNKEPEAVGSILSRLDIASASRRIHLRIL
ncbi:hypothetical protein IPO96_04825 [Candidatus Saccharibacteria bacterium]|jgi:hypothetical protein|nr:MAG: hypothetical protein IPO96_04825 [Candidatus Saccharibacteria bacterium]